MHAPPIKSIPRAVPIPLILFGLTLAVVVIYGRVVGHEFLMTWDDRLYVVQNDAVRGFTWAHLQTVFSNFYVGNYAPVQMISYMLDYELWGLRAGGYAVTNALVHLLNGFLFFRLLLRSQGKRLPAAIGALIFLIHPVQVESVAWISQRKNLLAMFFFLLAWECYDRYRAAEGSDRRLPYCASLVMITLALLAKSVAVIFPAVILAYDYGTLSDKRSIRFGDKIPYLLLSAAAIGLAILSQAPVEDNWGGAAGGGLTGYHGGSAWATLATMLVVACRYLGLLLWPTGLSAAYAPVIHTSVDPAVIGATVLLLLLAILSVRLFRRDSRLGFWLLYVPIAFAPVSQLVPLVTLMNDRYLYFPMLGFAALAGAGVSRLAETSSRMRRVAVLGTVAGMLLSMGLLSHNRVAVWHDDISFGRDTVSRCPTSYVSWEGLGEAYYFSGPAMASAALYAYRQALALNPSSILTLYNLGVLYVETGNDAQGYELLNKVVALNDRHAMAWTFLGEIFARRQQYDRAFQAYSRALAAQPDSGRALEGMAYLRPLLEMK